MLLVSDLDSPSHSPSLLAIAPEELENDREGYRDDGDDREEDDEDRWMRRPERRELALSDREDPAVIDGDGDGAGKGRYADIGGWVESTYELDDRDIEETWDDLEPTAVYGELEPTAVFER